MNFVFEPHHPPFLSEYEPTAVHRITNCISLFITTHFISLLYFFSLQCLPFHLFLSFNLSLYIDYHYSLVIFSSTVSLVYLFGKLHKGHCIFLRLANVILGISKSQSLVTRAIETMYNFVVFSYFLYI